MAILAILLAIKGASVWLCLATLIYIVVAVVTNWQSSTSNEAGILQDGQKPPEDIILEIIRTKGQAQRHDFLSVLKLSRTSLVRILDDMEKTGQIQQISERKSAFYALK